MYKNNQHLQTLHKLLKNNPPTHQLPFLQKIRNQALQTLQTNDLPITKNQIHYYKPYLLHLKKQLTQPTTPCHNTPLNKTLPNPLKKLNAHHIHLHNGHPINTPPPHIKNQPTILPLTKSYLSHPNILQKYFAQIAPTQKNTLIALNTLLHQPTYHIHLNANTQLNKPLILHHHITTPSTIHPRLLITLQQNTQLKLLYTTHLLTNKNPHINHLTEIHLDPHAHLDYYHLQTKQTQAPSQIYHTHIQQKASSTLNHYTLTHNQDLNHHQIETTLDQPHSQANLYALHNAKTPKAYTQINTFVNHKASHTTSKQLYKTTTHHQNKNYIIAGIHVQKNATKTQATQKHHALHLHPQATTHTQPILSIKTNDIHCSHGATISQPDPNQLLYLNTRGITPNTAHKLLTNAFSQEILDLLNWQELKHYIAQTL